MSASAQPLVLETSARRDFPPASRSAFAIDALRSHRHAGGQVMLIAQITDTHHQGARAARLPEGRYGGHAEDLRARIDGARSATGPDRAYGRPCRLRRCRRSMRTCARSWRRSPSRSSPSPATTTRAIRCDRAFARSRASAAGRASCNSPSSADHCGLSASIRSCPARVGGELCADRLSWLDATLAAAPDVPTLILMHHPPFLTGIAHMDRIGLTGRDEFAAIAARHPQIQAILCGHVHRVDPRPRRRSRRHDLPEPRPPGRARSYRRRTERFPPRAAGLHAAPLAGQPARLARGCALATGPALSRSSMRTASSSTELTG